MSGNTLYGLIAGVVNMFLDDEEEQDFEYYTRRYIGDLAFRGGVAGLTDLLGAEISVSERIGLSNMLLGSTRYIQGDSWEAQTLGMILGPSYGIISKAETAGRDFSNGDYYRGFESISPASIKNLMKAARYVGEDGVYTRRKDPILDNDSDLNAAEILGQALGLMPAELSRRMELRSYAKNMDNAVNARKSKLSKRLYKARRDGLPIKRIQKDIDAFNAKYPNNAIDKEYLKRSQKQHAKTSLGMREFGGVTISPKNMQDARVIMEDIDMLPWFLR